MVPRVPTPPPDALRRAHADWEWTVVWDWPGTSSTWRLDHPERSSRFCKVGRRGRHPDAAAEAARLRWARPHAAVPEVLDEGANAAVDWLLTEALGGTDATVHAHKRDPPRLVPALARGLSALHAALPVESCPFVFTAAISLEHARRRVRDGAVDPATDLHAEHRHLGLDGAIRRLEALAPDTEDLVVCHGDYCLPNVLLDAAGSVTGYVDLGELGVADRWWDIAVGSWSVTWNLGPGWEKLFIESYGVPVEPRRIAFYRLLYDLVS